MAARLLAPRETTNALRTRALDDKKNTFIVLHVTQRVCVERRRRRVRQPGTCAAGARRREKGARGGAGGRGTRRATRTQRDGGARKQRGRSVRSQRARQRRNVAVLQVGHGGRGEDVRVREQLAARWRWRWQRRRRRCRRRRGDATTGSASACATACAGGAARGSFAAARLVDVRQLGLEAHAALLVAVDHCVGHEPSHRQERGWRRRLGRRRRRHRRVRAGRAAARRQRVHNVRHLVEEAAMAHDGALPAAFARPVQRLGASGGP